MPTSLVGLQILLILLPGFAAAYTVQLLVTRRTQSELERVIEGLLYSFIIYVLYMPLNHGRLPFHIVKDPVGNQDTVLWEPANLAVLAAIVFVFSLVVTAYFNFDGNRLFRLFDTENEQVSRRLKWLKLTERTTRNSIWNDILETEYIAGQFVQVELVDGRSLLGVVHYYSDDSQDGSIYLAEASWLTSDGDPVPIPGAGILLTKASQIQSISLLDSKREADPPETSEIGVDPSQP